MTLSLYQVTITETNITETTKARSGFLVQTSEAIRAVTIAIEVFRTWQTTHGNSIKKIEVQRVEHCSSVYGTFLADTAKGE